MYNDYSTYKIIVTLNKDCAYSDLPEIYCGLDVDKTMLIYKPDNSDKLYKADTNDESGMGYIICLHLKNKDKAGVDAAVEKLMESPHVAYAEPDYYYGGYMIPNDRYFDNLWGTKKVNSHLAWDYSTGSNNIVVGVTDSGIDYNHPDIQANMWISPDKKHINGRNFADDYNNWDSMDTSGHGTHVAGTIGAVGNNFVGIPGICWNIKLAALKIGSGVFSLGAAIQSIDFANKYRIPVLNNSWGGRTYSPSLKYAISDYDGLFVTAAGNYGTNNDYIPDYPSSYDCDNIISVAASDPRDQLASFSNYGAKSVDIAAPGTDILSLESQGDYTYKNGTSMAAPHVAGAAALLKAYMPHLNTPQIKNIILASARKHANLEGKILTGGVLDINAMLETARNQASIFNYANI